MIEVAKKAAIEAGKIVLSLRDKQHTVKEKTNLSDITTEADIAAEKEILKILKTSFPNHSYLSEEIGAENNGSDFQWIIDPIDGTLAYFSGLPTFGISIGLLKKGEPCLGVINLPVLDNLCWAEKDKGAFLNNKKIETSDKKDLDRSIVGFDFAFAGTRAKEAKKLLIPLVDEVGYPPIFACTAVGLVYVAQGIYDAYIHSAYPWDFVAGAAIIEEAGGKVTDYEGKPIDWSKDWIDFFASNSHLHNKILSLIK